MQTSLAQRLSATNLRDASSTLPGKIALGLAATLVIALAAHVSFPLWFTPVPFTLQPLAVLGVGLAFGPVGGFLTLLAYLAEGASGLPVFSPAGPGGIAQLVGPTGGFLLAYPLVAAIAGGLTRTLARRVSSFTAAAIACAAATVVLFLSGMSWFALFTHLPLRAVWIDAVAPFLPGEAIKVLAAAGIYSTLRRRNEQPSARI
jgi:biotin transport system substrate-specific component